jgi:peptide/nickel transport system permease protein
MGESKSQILFKYIIPNGIFPVIANTTIGMSNAILTEAGLSFLGLGDPNVISWGQMIYEGKSFITSAWWISTFAGIAIIITVIIFYLLGDGLNHVLNPKHALGKDV